MCAALASAIALLTTMASVDANAASVESARPSTAAATHLSMSPRGASLFDKSWTVKFRNSYGKHVDVAIMKWNPDKCGGEGGNWETKGWFGLEPGEVKSVFSTSNRNAGYYAEAVDGHEWKGDRGPVYVYNDAFDSCLNIGSSAAYGTIGMRLVQLPDMSFPTTHINHTINLIP
jgi:hypothetical protein